MIRNTLLFLLIVLVLGWFSSTSDGQVYYPYGYYPYRSVPYYYPAPTYPYTYPYYGPYSPYYVSPYGYGYYYHRRGFGIYIR